MNWSNIHMVSMNWSNIHCFYWPTVQLWRSALGTHVADEQSRTASGVCCCTTFMNLDQDCTRLMRMWNVALNANRLYRIKVPIMMLPAMVASSVHQNARAITIWLRHWSLIMTMSSAFLPISAHVHIMPLALTWQCLSMTKLSCTQVSKQNVNNTIIIANILRTSFLKTCRHWQTPAYPRHHAVKVCAIKQTES